VFSNRQSFRRGPRASARHHRCTNRSGRSARRRFGRAGFQPIRRPFRRAPQADPVRHFPVSIFDFPSFAVAFLIRYQQLEFNVNHSKQSTETISNPQNPRYLESSFIAKSGGQFGHALHPHYPFSFFPFSRPPATLNRRKTLRHRSISAQIKNFASLRSSGSYRRQAHGYICGTKGV
jgi:hypothetical protein